MAWSMPSASSRMKLPAAVVKKNPLPLQAAGKEPAALLRWVENEQENENAAPVLSILFLIHMTAEASGPTAPH